MTCLLWTLNTKKGGGGEEGGREREKLGARKGGRETFREKERDRDRQRRDRDRHKESETERFTGHSFWLQGEMSWSEDSGEI